MILNNLPLPLRRRVARRGAALMLIVLFIMLSAVCICFTVELGGIRLAQAEIQNAADGAARAAVHRVDDANISVGNARTAASANHTDAASRRRVR